MGLSHSCGREPHRASLRLNRKRDVRLTTFVGVGVVLQRRVKEVTATEDSHRAGGHGECGILGAELSADQCEAREYKIASAVLRPAWGKGRWQVGAGEASIHRSGQLCIGRALQFTRGRCVPSVVVPIGLAACSTFRRLWYCWIFP